MSAYHFRPLNLPMPEAWRALDRAVARWVSIHGGGALLAQVAGWASLAEGHGDSALPLCGEEAGRHGMPALDEAALAQLRGDALVGDARSHGTPFVLDGEWFYLRRNFAHEAELAQRLRRRFSAATPAPLAEADLDALFAGAARTETQAQRSAVREAPGKPCFVLTGGPGTGKTHTVLRMLLALAKERAERGQPPPRIRLAAPTGKAARRLAQSLRAGAEGLRDLPPPWRARLDETLAAQTGTLHRLLGKRDDGYRHHAGDPLPADVVVVDEASMADLDLLHALLDALREDAVLILVGDADQLTPVGTGSVLRDVVGALEAEASPALVRLHRSFRAEAALTVINEAILRGDATAFAEAFRAAGVQALWRETATAADLRRALADWCRDLLALLRGLHVETNLPADGDAQALAALDGLRSRQLLCALREGEFGAQRIGTLIEDALRGELGADDAIWYPGRAVMIVHNDATAGLYNGDVGICLCDARGEPGVWFEATGEGAAARRAVRHAPGGLPAHQGAFAATIHKSQGSEYGRVAVLLPPDAGHRILSRQLLYTGASRARHALEIWGTQAAVDAAIATPARRAGGLMRRLRAGA